MGDDIMYISQALIDNINDSNSNAIEVYLRANNIQKAEEDEGMETKLWVNKLFGQSKINLDNFEEFLFSELFYGKRKLIRVYKIDECRKYSLPTDWGEGLALYSDGKGYEFSNILSSEPNEKKTAKIVATKMIKNEDGELNNLKLIFAYDIKLQGKDGELEKSCVYIPVEIDFINERMVIKAWQRKRVALETDRCESLFERTLNILNNNFHVKYVNIGTKHKKVLYQLSKNLIDNVYNQIPAFKAVADCSEIIKGFSNEIINRLPLENVVDSDENKILNEGVMQFEREIYNDVEGLAINDYFFEKKFSDIWDMGIEGIVARIRFKDGEKVITSLKGENTVMPIFVTKTFMTLRERMNAEKRVEAIWIALAREKSNLNLKYDAADADYLEIWIRYGIKFREDDMQMALRIYDKYEEQVFESVEKQIENAVGQ